MEFIPNAFVKGSEPSMNIPQIQITKTDIQMDWQTRQGKLTIKQPEATLNISQPAAQLDINTTDAQVHINMDQLWRDLAMKPMGEVIDDYAQKGKQAVLQNISSKVSEGRQMMMGAGKGQGASTLQQIAKQSNGPHRAGPINIRFIPSHNAVKVNITQGKVDINVQRNDPKIDASVNKPIIDYTAGSVSGTMRVRPDVTIDVIG